MEASGWTLVALVTTVLLAAAGTEPGDLFEVDVRRLAALWESEHTSPAGAAALKHADLVARLEVLERESAGALRVEAVGSSVEGRKIYHAVVGTGPARILFWSQMHGDEPTATSAILDLLAFFARHRKETWVDRILRAYTLDFVPMLNPDGAERSQRRNAQGIDINRDARSLATPEGRVLQALSDRLKPMLGFNLHDQSGLTTVGDTGKVATISLLAVAADAAPRAAASGELAKRVTAVLYEALAPFIYGHIARYNEDFNPRAFGDNLTLAGTPIVLVESGGTPSGAPSGLTVKLNFVGLLAVLDSLASGRVERANPAVFDAMKRNSDTPIFDLLLRNAWISAGNGVPLFRGDVAVRRNLRARSRGDAMVADLGDLAVFTAHETIDCSRMLVTPGLIAWAPEQSISGPKSKDAELLRRGVVTILETAAAGEVPRVEKSRKRTLHWSFVVSGRAPRTPEGTLRIAAWLAAGARAWIVERPEANDAEVAGWFAVEPIARREASRFELPERLAGDPVEVLARHTSEAARRFRLARRGVIAPGAAADLVLWSLPGTEAPRDLKDCRPARVILDGRALDLEAPELPRAGRFLGR